MPLLQKVFKRKYIRCMLNKKIFWKEDKVILEWQCPGSPTSQPYWWSEPVGQKRNCLLCPTWWHTLTRIFPDNTREDVFSIRKLTNAVFRMTNPIIKDQNVAAKRSISWRKKSSKTVLPKRLPDITYKAVLTKRLNRSWQNVFLTKRLPDKTSADPIVSIPLLGMVWLPCKILQQLGIVSLAWYWQKYPHFNSHRLNTIPITVTTW